MGTHPIFESDFDCLTEISKMSEIVYAAGEGPSAPVMSNHGAVLPVPQPVKMVRAKQRDEEEHKAFHPNVQVARWPSGYIKKLRRKDGNWNYFNKDRELFKNLHLVKLYQYE